MMSSHDKLKLLCDENLPKRLVEMLRDAGFDLITVIPGTLDKKIAELAQAKERVILTFDKHFGNRLLFPPEQFQGIVFIRIRPPLINTVFTALENLFAQVPSKEFKGRLFVVSSGGYRLYPKYHEKRR